MGLKRRVSSSPVAAKLRLRDGQHVAFVHKPRARLFEVPAGVTASDGLTDAADVVIAFHTDKQALLAEIPALQDAVGGSGTLWIAYPKGTSGHATDLNRDIIWAALLPLGLRPNFQIAIDDTWSALRFVRDERSRT